MNSGKLIVIEGACDGIGKSTQYNLLKEYLKEKGYNVAYHHFPTYNTYQGAPVEKYLSGEYGNISDLSPYFINNLYAMDRVITWHTDLKDKYLNGDIIILDRYTTSSLIYQSALIENIDEKKKFIDWVCDYEYNKLGIKKPDMVIFLTAPFDVVNELRMSRADNDGIKNDLHERDLSFMKKVYDNALFVADYLSWNKIECSFNGKMRTIEDIKKDIEKLF